MIMKMKAQELIDETIWNEERKRRLRELKGRKHSIIPKVEKRIIEKIAWNNF